MVPMKHAYLLLLLLVLAGGCRQSEPVTPSPVIPPEMHRFRTAFSSADSITVFGLEPEYQDSEPTEGLFHHYPILKQVTVAQADSREMMNLFWSDYDPDAPQALCFSPRHGLRTEWQSDTYDLNICYQCASVHAYLNDNRVGQWTWAAKSVDKLNQALQQTPSPIPAPLPQATAPIQTALDQPAGKSAFDNLNPSVKPLVLSLDVNQIRELKSGTEGESRVGPFKVGHRQAFIDGTVAGKSVWGMIQDKISGAAEKGKMTAEEAVELNQLIDASKPLKPEERKNMLAFLDTIELEQ